jgi:hypothetical protein
MVTNSTTSTATTLDPTMGSFSTGESVVSEVEKEEATAKSLLEKKILRDTTKYNRASFIRKKSITNGTTLS